MHHPQNKSDSVGERITNSKSTPTRTRTHKGVVIRGRSQGVVANDFQVMRDHLSMYGPRWYVCAREEYNLGILDYGTFSIKKPLLPLSLREGIVLNIILHAGNI